MKLGAEILMQCDLHQTCGDSSSRNFTHGKSTVPKNEEQLKDKKGQMEEIVTNEGLRKGKENKSKTNPV